MGMPLTTTASNGQRVPFKTRFTVLATDRNRPGWSFVWGGTTSRKSAVEMVRKFQAQSGTGHLTFVIRQSV